MFATSMRDTGGVIFNSSNARLSRTRSTGSLDVPCAPACSVRVETEIMTPSSTAAERVNTRHRFMSASNGLETQLLPAWT